MQVQPASGEAPSALLSRILDAAIRIGRGGTLVFGVRQQRKSFPFFCQQLAILHPDAVSDRDRIERSFGPTRFIHLTRGDKLAQAVSLLKAEQSGLWHVGADGSEVERTASAQPPRYDGTAIRQWSETLAGYDTAWTGWFGAEGITPIRLTYEDLSAAPVATLRGLLDDLGLDPAAADGVTPGLRRMSDDLSQKWIRRYLAEEGS